MTKKERKGARPDTTDVVGRSIGMVDSSLVAMWCRLLGSGPVATLFEAGYLSEVVGLRLADGRKVVLKVRDWQDRLLSDGDSDAGRGEGPLPPRRAESA